MHWQYHSSRYHTFEPPNNDHVTALNQNKDHTLPIRITSTHISQALTPIRESCLKRIRPLYFRTTEFSITVTTTKCYVQTSNPSRHSSNSMSQQAIKSEVYMPYTTQKVTKEETLLRAYGETF